MLAWCWCYWESTPFCFAWLLEKLVIPASVAALIYGFGIRQLKRKRAIDFAEKQLTEFYGPMVAARTKIESFSGFDNILRAAAHYSHARALAQDHGETVTTQRAQEMLDESAQAERFWDALNERFVTDGIDALLAMRTLFAAKIVYADPDTRSWYEYFHAFVEMWLTHRANKERQFIPRQIAGTVGAMFDEELLQPFYAHLRERAEFYHAEIAGERRSKVLAPPPPSAAPRDLLDRLETNPFFGRRRRKSAGDSED